MRPFRAALTAGAIALCSGIALVVGAAPASAHPMPHSVVQLDVLENAIEAQLQLPVDDVARATELELATAPEQAVAENAQRLRDYLTEHVRPTSNGQEWEVDVGDLSVSDAEQTSTGPYRELIAELTLTPPAGAALRQFTLDYDVVIDQVVTHVVHVVLQQDWAGGRVDPAVGQQIGVIRIDTATMTVPPLEVDLDDASTWQGFLAMVSLGGHHIAEGTDHLLFLLTLLLPAPLLLAGRQRWDGAAGGRAAAVAITRITVAFTIGHSVTLALSVLGRFELPTRPVEALIAASILVSAVHARRPIFPGREALVAGLFGLVHGMAFSFTLAELDLSTSQLIVSLLGFNLGIELVQLLVVALTLPALVVLTRNRRLFRVLRTAGAALAGVAATGWLLDRLGWANPVAAAADAFGAHGAWLIAALWAVAVAVVVVMRIAPSRSRGSGDHGGGAVGADRTGRKEALHGSTVTSAGLGARGGAGRA